jgi:hypothetical protein
MRQHYILTLDPRCREVFAFIQQHNLTRDVHLNRTRFWIPDSGPITTEFALRFLDCCPEVLEDPDNYALGGFHD